MDKYLPYRNLNCEEEEYIDFSVDIPDHFFFFKGRNIIRIELNDYKEFDIHVNCRVPRKINEYLYEENHSDPGFLVSVNFSCIESNTRFSILLDHVRRYLFRGSIRADPDTTGSHFRLSVQISRKDHGDFSNRKFASRKGSLLAWSEPKEFWLEDPPLNEGTEIRGEWIDFEQNGAVPSSFRKELFFLDQTEKHPRIMMNSSMDRSLLNLIMYKGFGNPKSYLRESLFRFIALNVWTQLVDAGISEIREKISENGRENFSPADIKTWKIEVLMKILPVMYPEEGRNANPETFIGRFNDEKFFVDFHIRKQLALQKFLDSGKTIQKTIEAISGRRSSLRN